jgi:hypothetical protein
MKKLGTINVGQKQREPKLGQSTKKKWEIDSSRQDKNSKRIHKTVGEQGFSSVEEPDTGSGAFLTPGSGIPKPYC